MRVLIAAGWNGRTHLPGNCGRKRSSAPRPGCRQSGSLARRVAWKTNLVPQAGFELSLIDSAGLKNVGAV